MQSILGWHILVLFCDRCKTCRPYIRGVLRGARIWHSPYIGKTDYITDSEYSYYSSEGEPCTQEDAEENYLTQEAARTKALMNKAVECLSTRPITERLGTHLAEYTEIKLFRTCKQIYLGNRARNNWWANMNSGGPITKFKWSAPITSNRDTIVAQWHITAVLAQILRISFQLSNSDMRREHVFTKCTQCGWRQRSYAIRGKICFDEYYCKRCGGQLLICVRIQLTKGKQNMLPLVIRETRACLLTYILRMGGYWVA